MRTYVVGDIHGRCAQLLNLLDMLPRDPENDTLVFLGDLIDRGADAPGCVNHILKLCRENPERVICLRGNHEQMLLDFLEGRSNLWLTAVVGGERTFEQYTGRMVKANSEKDLEELRLIFELAFPREHLAFMQDLPYYYEDAHAIYVHAGLDEGKHPSETRRRRFYGCATWIFTKTIAANPASLDIRRRPFCPCGAGWAATEFTSHTARWASTPATTTNRR